MNDEAEAKPTQTSHCFSAKPGCDSLEVCILPIQEHQQQMGTFHQRRVLHCTASPDHPRLEYLPALGCFEGSIVVYNMVYIYIYQYYVYIYIDSSYIDCRGFSGHKEEDPSLDRWAAIETPVEQGRAPVSNLSGCETSLRRDEHSRHNGSFVWFLFTWQVYIIKDVC